MALGSFLMCMSGPAHSALTARTPTQFSSRCLFVSTTIDHRLEGQSSQRMVDEAHTDTEGGVLFCRTRHQQIDDRYSTHLAIHTSSASSI